MKIVRVFSMVLAAHVVMALLFVQGGCQSRQTPPADTGGEMGLQPVDWEDEEPRVETARAAPTRPTTPPPSPVATDERAPEVLRPLPTETPRPSPRPSGEPASVYTVRSGDSLWLIAQRHGVSVNALTDYNGLRSDAVIQPGQELSIPPGGSREPGPAPTSPASTASRPEGTTSYTVQRGDSLSVIAQRHNTSVRNLQNLNNLSNDVIRVGQTLVVPERSGSPRPSQARSSEERPAATADSGARHVVRSGETPGGIAARYNVTVDELMKANNISDPRRLQIGQELIVPGRETRRESPPQERARPAETPAPRPAQPEPPLDPVDILQDNLDDLPVIDVEPDDTNP